jgi:hypothetical protein
MTVDASVQLWECGGVVVSWSGVVLLACCVRVSVMLMVMFDV